jgi:hypothetical protein
MAEDMTICLDCKFWKSGLRSMSGVVDNLRECNDSSLKDGSCYVMPEIVFRNGCSLACSLFKNKNFITEEIKG